MPSGWMNPAGYMVEMSGGIKLLLRLLTVIPSWLSSRQGHLLKEQPPAIMRLVRDIRVAFGKQDWHVVEEKSETLAELAPEAFTTALWQERGLALLALGAPAQALEALEQALNTDPHDIPTIPLNIGSRSVQMRGRHSAVQIHMND